MIYAIPSAGERNLGVKVCRHAVNCKHLWSSITRYISVSLIANNYMKLLSEQVDELLTLLIQ